MFKAGFLIFWMLALAVLPAAAMDAAVEAADLVPADFAGFIRLRVESNAALTLGNLNVSAALAAELQPARVRLTQALTYDDLIPLNALFDVENASFESVVLPWLGGEVVLAYRRFDAALKTEPDDVLLILPAANLFQAAASLRPILEAQDFPDRDAYRGVTLYRGDRSAVAFTSSAVLVGAEEVVRAALDVAAGEAEPLTAGPAFRAVQAAISPEAFLFAYTAGDYLPPALTGLISGRVEAGPLFAALGGALRDAHGEPRLETLLLGGGFDGAAISLEIDRDNARYTAAAVFHPSETPKLNRQSTFDPALLDMIPRAALLVQRGDSLQTLAYDTLALLPLSNFGGQMIGGLPLTTAGGSSPQVLPPTAADLQSAVEGFFDGLRAAGGFDPRSSLLDYLPGGYALALLPRPNDPLPVLGVPFDLLLVAPAEGGEEAVDGARRLLELAFGLQPVGEAGAPFVRLGRGQTPIFEIGVVDGVLIVATGDAAQRALAARRGDNRLVDQPGWLALNTPEAPGLYLDSAVFFNTFFPTPGGRVPGENERVRLGLWSGQRDDDLFELRLVVALPTQ
ncbi:MAG: DUF3352 domain-containing protein [Chloroflexi bacterium]|nr:DUF3352 domain-containing protein [Chloroflexota bacterium]